MAEHKRKTKKIPSKKIVIRKKQTTRGKPTASSLKKLKKPLKKSVRKPIRKKNKKIHNGVALSRASSNPMISPIAHASWESKATFNPSAVYGGGKVHLIYRAIGESDVSVLGYAGSYDGITVDNRGTFPAYIEGFMKWKKSKTAMPISYSSGGGWSGGSEDPRLTLLDGTVFMFYTSFDGWGSVRMALTSIDFDDFSRGLWNWKKPVFVSPPGEIHKNWVLFPEKIKGKYAILHGISPDILIDYVDDIDSFDGTKFIKSKHTVGGGYKDAWDNALRGVGPSPIKTEHGWLVLYHAMDIKDPNRYKLGAMLLDLRNPSKVLARSHQPILEPDEGYENEGFKSGVVYACGAVVKDGRLFVYYGGADKVACVATAELEPFLKSIIAPGTTKTTKLTRKK
jgi:predicted GH43/DUF377 family glycosyl hydrolase